MRRRGAEQRDASFLEPSLRPRRALPSELGSRRAVLLEHERVPTLRVVVRSTMQRPLVIRELFWLEREGVAEQCCQQCTSHYGNFGAHYSDTARHSIEMHRLFVAGDAETKFYGVRGCHAKR